MIDSHAHLNFQAFNDDYSEVIRRSFDNGIAGIINVGSNYLTSQKAVKIAKEFGGCYAALGLHPIHASDEGFPLSGFRNLLKGDGDTIKAIGETGLDYYRSTRDAPIVVEQRQVFLKHLELAQEFDLPVILHCRGDKNQPFNACQDLLSILRSRPRVPRGVIHCFVADWPTAQKFLDLGFYVGFTGIITYSNAGDDLLEAVKRIPLNRILSETDCPYLAPEPIRHQRCEPWHVKYTLEKIAEIKDVAVDEIERQTAKNAQDLFGFLKI
ncbi:MAG: TatD family hydrolase [Candidatus Parcubacteria bacterium]|nr:TatD family hydrolase [Candidatus Parcubacteria bacterium]